MTETYTRHFPTAEPETHFERERNLIATGGLTHLSEVAFKVWFVYHQAAGQDGAAWPGLSAIAKKLGHKTISSAKKGRRELVHRGLLKPIRNAGGSENGKYQVAGIYVEPGCKLNRGTDSTLDRGANRTHTGVQIGALHNKEEQPIEHTSKQPISYAEPQAASASVTVDEIYKAYPRHRAPVPGKKAIAKALKEIAKRGEPNPSEFLLGKVKLFAKARKAAMRTDPRAMQFTPHPATWFNGGSYDDAIESASADNWEKESFPDLTEAECHEYAAFLKQSNPSKGNRHGISEGLQVPVIDL